MPLTRRRFINAWAAAALLGACSRPRPRVPADDAGRLPIALQYLGDADIAGRVDVDHLRVGGLSGIDYDARRDVWWLISDDRSEHSPARVYAARIAWTSGGLDVRIEHGVVLKTPEGKPYRKNHLDPESIRVSPAGTLWISSEGVPRARVQPWIREFDVDGRFMRELPLPDSLALRRGRTTGPYDNASFEGLALAPGGDRLWAAVEGPLKQDADPPTVERGAPVRFTRFDLRSGAPDLQYVYELSAIPKAPIFGLPEDVFADMGVSEILMLDERRFLALERSYATGVGITARIHLAEIEDATSDVLGLPTLLDADYRPLRKTLLMDGDRLPVSVDNLEGMAIGPRLPNGERLFVMCSDDNFNPLQRNQFLAFALSETSASPRSTAQIGASTARPNALLRAPSQP